MRFLIRDCQCVKWMASPKQPQSITGLKITRIAVMIVKNDIRESVMIPVILLKTPDTSITPVKVSRRARATAIGMAAPLRKPMWRKFRYSLMMRLVPTGSITLRIPLSRNTIPVSHPHRRLSLNVIYISLIFNRLPCLLLR